MTKERASKRVAGARIATLEQVSAGGVTFRRDKSRMEVVIVSVMPGCRWQLPKGIVEQGESPEAAALREVREEAGIDADLITSIETIEYWYVGERRGQRVRYHKFVHFYLMAYRSGDISNHDHEVAEARWVSIDEALELLAFKNERVVVEKAREMIAAFEKAG
jgi:8-oxo-dGTP diphosphatase